MHKLENDLDTTLTMGVEDGWEGYMNIPDRPLLFFISDEDYYYIFSHPDKYKNQLFRYIETDSIKWEYKYMAIGLLQGLCIDEYTPVLEKIYTLTRKEIIEESCVTKQIKCYESYPYADALLLAIQQEGLSQEVYKNYKNSNLKKVLNKISTDAMIPIEIRRLCEDIINGVMNVRIHSKEYEQYTTIPIFECRNGKKYYRSISFYLGVSSCSAGHQEV